MSKTKEPDTKQVKLVFTGRRLVKNGTKLIQTWVEEDAIRANPAEAELIFIDLTRSPAVGQVYLATQVGDSQWYTKGEHAAEYVERWDLDDPLMVEWTIKDGAAVAEHGARARQKKEGRANALAEALEPVRDAYRKAPPNTRRAILAEVMRIVTS